MTREIKISVVIACYNDGEFLKEAIQSVEACPEKNVEMVIVNDGSTDVKTCVLLSELGQKGYRVIHQENGGTSAARNAGVRATKGRYILPLDADNRILPQYFVKAASILDRFPKVGVVYGDCRWFGDENKIFRPGVLDRTRLVLQNSIDACAVYRREVWEQVGGYDENPILSKNNYEDWDFWLMAVEHDWEFHYLPEVMFEYRVRPGTRRAKTTREVHRMLLQYLSGKHFKLLRDELARSREFIDKIFNCFPLNVLRKIKQTVRAWGQR